MSAFALLVLLWKILPIRVVFACLFCCMKQGQSTELCACRLIVKPAVRFAARTYAAEERRRLSEQIEEARQHAVRQQAVMGARVARLAAADCDKTGFHVIKVLHVCQFECMLCMCCFCFRCRNRVVRIAPVHAHALFAQHDCMCPSH